MSEPEQPPRGCTRRSVLLGVGLFPGLALGLLSGVSGCGVRWEGVRQGQPDPSTGTDPGVTALLLELARCQAAESAAASGTGTMSARLARLHAQQRAALLRRLAESGVDGHLEQPSSAITPISRRTADSTANPTAGPTVSPALRLLAAESAGLDLPGRAAVAGVPADDIALVGSLHVQRAVAVHRLGGSLPPWPAPVVASPEEGARLLSSTRAAEYGLAVAAAQADRARAVAASRALASIQTRRRLLASLAPDTSPAPLGHVLPFPVRTPQAADRLGILVSQRLSASTLAGLPRAVGRPDAVATLLGWVHDSELIGLDWGASPPALPGLISP